MSCAANIKPEVSLIMPCYNRAAVLQQTLDCVLQQTFTNFELICVDDGSTDDVPKVLAAYAQKDSRIKIITKPHSNPGDARNLGYEHSVAPYVMFLDADEIYDPTLVAVMLEQIKKYPADLVICEVVNFNHHDSYQLSKIDPDPLICAKFGRDKFLKILFGFACYVCRRIFKREIIDQHQIRFQSISCGEDQLFVFNYELHCQDILYYNVPLVYHRINDQTSLSSISGNCDALFDYCLAMQKVRTCFTADDWKILQTQFYNYYFGEICYAVVRSGYRQGRKIFRFIRHELRGHWHEITISNASKRRHLAQFWFKRCLRWNNYPLFYLLKTLMLRCLAWRNRR